MTGMDFFATSSQKYNISEEKRTSATTGAPGYRIMEFCLVDPADIG